MSAEGEISPEELEKALHEVLLEGPAIVITGRSDEHWDPRYMIISAGVADALFIDPAEMGLGFVAVLPDSCIVMLVEASDIADAEPVICPECAQDKHQNCIGSALDEATDEIVDCVCDQAGHQ